MTDAEAGQDHQPEKPTRLARLIGWLLKTSVNAGMKEDDQGLSWISRQIKHQKDKVLDAVPEGINLAVADTELQTEANEYIKQTAQDVVKAIRTELLPAANTSRERRLKSMETVVGVSDQDKWYKRIGKKVLARLMATGLPVVNYILARMITSTFGEGLKQKYGIDDLSNTTQLKQTLETLQLDLIDKNSAQATATA